MKQKTVIAVSGYAQAGKDTFADNVEALIGNHCRCLRFKFAEPLRKSAELSLNYLGINVSPWTEKKEEKDKIRPLFIALGEYARSQDVDVFAKIAVKEIKNSLMSNADVAFITDLRYSNEGRLLRDMCVENNFRYLRVHIVREGNKPASEVEERSVASLLLEDISYEAYSAGNGDFDMIKSFSRYYVSKHFDFPYYEGSAKIA